MVVENKYYFYVVLTKNKIRHINIIHEMEYTLNNEIDEKMEILEKFRKNNQIWTRCDGETHVTKFDCRLKGEMRTILHSNRIGPHYSLETRFS